MGSVDVSCGSYSSMDTTLFFVGLFNSLVKLQTEPGRCFTDNLRVSYTTFILLKKDFIVSLFSVPERRQPRKSSDFLDFFTKLGDSIKLSEYMDNF